jgi:CHASE3 domain sensor protein
MRKRSKTNIRLSFSLSLIILLLSSIASYFSITKLLDSEKWVDHTFKVQERLDFVLSRMKDAETGQRGYLLTGDKIFLEPYTSSQQEVTDAVGDVEILTLDNPAQQKDFPNLRSLIEKKYQLIKRTVVEKERGIQVTTGVLLDGKYTMDSLRVFIKGMQERENVLLKERQSRMSAFVTYSPVLIALGALISICITLYFYFLVQRDFRETVRLEEELIRQEKDTRQQIEVIGAVAKKIADGDYEVRIKESDLHDGNHEPPQNEK